MRIYHRSTCIEAKVCSSKVKHYSSAPIEKLVAQYTANTSGVLPVFNQGYVYKVQETEKNGIYTVKIYSDTDFTSCSFREKTNLLTVEYLKVTNNVTNMSYMFYNCRALTSLNTSNWDTSKVTNMNYMFEYCISLTSLDLSGWDINNVTHMQQMFCYCINLLNINLSNWSIHNEAIITSMFDNSGNIESVTMNSSDYNSVNKIISELPTRTTDSMGILDITEVDNVSQVDITTAQSKYWNIEGVQLGFVLGKSKLGIDKL